MRRFRPFLSNFVTFYGKNELHGRNKGRPSPGSVEAAELARLGIFGSVAASWTGTQEKLIIAGQNKLNSARQNKLTMIQLNKLNFVLHEKLRIVRRNKLTKARELWQAHMKNWPNPLRP
jgi:hypothetical protein